MIERVCVVGAGVIGSLYAGHLARVTEVTCLVRREEHARALNQHGLRVSGRHHFLSRLTAATSARAHGRPSRARLRVRRRGDFVVELPQA